MPREYKTRNSSTDPSRGSLAGLRPTMNKEEDTRHELVEELKQLEQAVAELRELRDTATSPRDWMERDLSLHRVETALEKTREAVHEVERTQRDQGDDE